MPAGTISAKSVILSLIIFAYFPSANTSRAAGERYSDLAAELARIETTLSNGDTTATLAGLDALLKEKRNYSPASILRGRIHFSQRERKKALQDFQQATGSSEKKDRLEAWLWLSRTQRMLFNDKRRAADACRKGLSIDGNHSGLLYEQAMIGFSYGPGNGYLQAAEYLTRVIEIDPLYGNAYHIWRDSLFFHPVYDNGRVRGAMKRYLASNPDSACWWVEIAWDEFLAGKADSALAVLERLKTVRPDYDSADRELLLARCVLESGDSLGFQKHYQRSLDLSAERDEITRAFTETEVILLKQAAPRWGECKSSREKAAFLRWYWIDMDDDPIEPLNRRLIEHYNRLRHAESHYLLRNPHSYFQQSEDYNRLVTPQSRIYYYDPDPLRRQSDLLHLDPRGVVWVRFGSPEKLEKHFSEGNISNININEATPQVYKNKALIPDIERNIIYRESAISGANHEFWYYGRSSLLFVDYAQAGEYVLIPQQSAGANVNISKVLDSERWIDPQVNYTLDYYMAKFLASNSFDNEVEFYQDDWLPKGERPTATIAVYDSLWGEFGRSEGEVFRIGTGQEYDHWLARHRITVFPGKYNYTIRMVSNDEKWLGRGEMEVPPFTPDSLQISAVMLGTVPLDGFESPNRLGLHVVPRPTTRFWQGEPVSVYLELYGLQPDSAGRHHYKEWIDVIRLKEEESRIKKYTGKIIDLFSFDTDPTRASVSLAFEREADWRGDRAPEFFTLDTSALKNGAYRMVLQVRDNVSGLWDIEEVFFDVEDEAKVWMEP